MPTVRLAASLEAPAMARAFVVSTLFSWGRRTSIPIVELVATELVANAVQHAVPPIGLALSLDGERLRVAVSDGAPDTPPVRRTTLPGTEGGYGLNIVDTLAEAWGYDVDGALKAVWADLDLNLAQAW
jgi:anti-sigma regulatory factor (Ser/Thr protein kinase)